MVEILGGGGVRNTDSEKIKCFQEVGFDGIRVHNNLCPTLLKQMSLGGGKIPFIIYDKTEDTNTRF